VLLVSPFSPTVDHFSKGQISLKIAILLILAAFCLDSKAYIWAGLLCVFALPQPQLCLLIHPCLPTR